MPGVSSETQVMALDLAGIAISAGSACSSGKVRRSHVLVAMGVAAEIAESAIRISLGTDSRPEHIDRFVEGWAAIFARSGGERRRTAAR
jgi:cysteine desulfurase